MSQDSFDRFWAAFPRRVAKQAAQRAWTEINPPAALEEIMIVALQWQSRQPAWTKDGGAYVPHPATWLRGRRWEDEPFDPVSAPMPVERLTPFDRARRAGLK
jgi:hypothetical protein